MPQAANAAADDTVSSDDPGNEKQQLSLDSPSQGLPLAKTSQPSGKPGLFSRKRLLGPVDKERGDAALLAHSFVTGMVDAATFGNWSVFVGMQTGRFFFLFAL